MVSEIVGDVMIVDLPSEEIDASNAPQLKLELAGVVESRTKVVFDLSRVRFVDSSGLGAFLSCLRKVSGNGGELKLCCLQKSVRAVFELVRMDRVFDLHPTRASAVAAFATRTAEARAASA